MNSLVCDSSRSARAPERWHIVRAAIRDGERVGTRYASEGAPRSITMGRTRKEDILRGRRPRHERHTQGRNKKNYCRRQKLTVNRGPAWG